MTDQSEDSQHTVEAEPRLTHRSIVPKGVLQRNLKPMLYLGAALLVVVAALFSSNGKNNTKGQSAAGKHEPPQPAVEDNTENNVADLKNQVSGERQDQAQEAALAKATAADPAPGAGVRPQGTLIAPFAPAGQPIPCPNGAPCVDSSYGQQGNTNLQLVTPVREAEQQVEAKERERAYESRFSSNLAYSGTAPAQSLPRQTGVSSGGELSDTSATRPNAPAALSTQSESNRVAPRSTAEQIAQLSEPTSFKHRAEVNVDSAQGQPYVIYEGLTLDTVLMNRLDGDAVGPVKVLVSDPVYSHDHQHVLIPDGTVVLGEARKIGSAGFGQQRRIAVSFHRMIMPDGYSVDLDQFHGLDQIGEEGLKDKVNNHYIQVFGTSIALGVIAGAGQISQGGGTFNGSGAQQFTNGATSGISQSVAAVLDRFTQIPPTLTIREGHRVKVYFTQDLLLPAYGNHTIPQTF